MKQPYETRGLNRLEKSIFNSIRIECPNKCGEVLSYENYYSHLNNCENNIKSFQCNNCNKIIETQMDQELVNDHMTLCEKLCKFCEKSYNLLNYHEHESKCFDRIVKIFSRLLEWISENQKSEEFEKYLRALENS